jgi:predicted DNA-binding transcriptional regulator AlpA
MHLLSTAYLDAHDLAAILKVSPATILRRAKRQPHTLPAPAHLGPNFPLRWRRADVASWLAEGASSPGCSSHLDDALALCD